MRAAIRGEQGLEFAEVARPVPGADDVLVKVHAGALNRADLGMLAGHMHGAVGGTGTVLGLEWAGVVEAVGANVTHVRPGDRVMGSGKGAFAEYALADHGRVSPIPRDSMSFEDAATLPVALQTMHDAVVTNGGLQRGQTVLVQGASSGVGLMAQQIAKRMGASRVIGSSTDAGRRARLTEFGADLAIDSRDPDWVQQVLEATDRRGVDLIVDQLSGPVANGNLAACAIEGRIVNVGRLAGMHADFDFDLHALRRIRYIGVTFRTRSTAEVREVNRRMRADLQGAVERGELRLPIDGRFDFDRLGEAFEHMRANRHFGKVVVRIAG